MNFKTCSTYPDPLSPEKFLLKTEHGAMLTTLDMVLTGRLLQLWESWKQSTVEKCKYCVVMNYTHEPSVPLSYIIIHQTHYKKSDWSRAFNQFTIAGELDMINAISAADIAFIMWSSTSAWLLNGLECSPQKQNGRMLRFYFRVWIMWKMYNKTIVEFSFRMISWIIKTLCLCYLPQPSTSADNTDLGFDNSWYHAQPHPIIVYR